jgi:hypothetical protein
MSFNKRYITKVGLLIASEGGLENLINYVRKPDALIIESDGISQKVCDLITKISDSAEIKRKLKEIGFYEFE